MEGGGAVVSFQARGLAAQSAQGFGEGFGVSWGAAKVLRKGHEAAWLDIREESGLGVGLGPEMAGLQIGGLGLGVGL